MTPTKSNFARQDKINIVTCVTGLFTLLIVILGVVLKFWTDTEVRLAILDQRVGNLERSLKVEPAKVAVRHSHGREIDGIE